ncbi:MAG: hypothetical protein OEV35_03025 [Gallionellaceae bacterium]|nr:hypothetical protein [Gallionellaceae bacterium]
MSGELRNGITRIKKIVQNRKNFLHVDAVDKWHYSDLCKGVDSMRNIIQKRYRYIEVKGGTGQVGTFKAWLPVRQAQIVKANHE